MGGTYVDDDWELTSSSNEVRTLVLIGKTGNGKSATGNSIIGAEVFKSKRSSSGVTSSCERHTAVLDGQTVNVIDTPGLFDSSAESKFVGKEIVNCINLAKDGIHAFIVVFSVSSRFSKEEETTLRSLLTIFGEKISDYMILVFTGGDLLEKGKEKLQDYLSDCPEALKDVLTLCKNRYVLFNNYAEDERKKFEQVQQLLSFVNTILSQSGGRPYTDEFLTELKKGAMKLHSQQREVDSLEFEGYSNEEVLDMRKHAKQAHEFELQKLIAEMVELKLKEATVRLEEQLKEEQAARHKAEENSNKEIREVREQLRKAEENANKARELEELLRKAEEKANEARELKEQLRKAEENANEACKLKEQLRKVEEDVKKAHEELRKQGVNRCAIL